MGIIARVKGLSSDFFYGYWILFGTFLLHGVGSGIFFYGFSVFYTPILLDFGWSSATLSGAFSLSRLEGGLEGPVIGYLIDRYGARKLLFFGVLLTGLGFIALARVNSVFMFYLVYAGMMSIGYNTGFTHAMTTIVTSWFISKRSRAMSIFAVAAGLGGAIFVPILAKLVVFYGWRSTVTMIGLAFWIIGIPVFFILRNKPEDVGLLPDGLDIEKFKLNNENDLTAENLGLEVEYTAGQALRSGTFWKLVIAESFRSFLLGSIVIHQIPHLINIGISEESAASILGLMITFSVPGRLVFGSLGDYYSKRKILILVMLMQALGIFIFSEASNIWYVYAFVLIYGFSYGGAIPLLMSFRGELFGRRRYATITGLMTPFKMVGSVIGPLAAGYIFDVYGSYKLAFQIFTLLALFSALAFFFVKSEDEHRILGLNKKKLI